MKSDCAVLITAAGFSGRMGVSKALLHWNKEMNFLQKLIATYSIFGCKEIIITLNEDCFAFFKKLSIPSVRYVLNPFPEKERMYSVLLGLKAIQSSSYCFIQAIDNPFIEANMVQEIYKHKTQDKVVTPTYNGKSGHPILINQAIINFICSMEMKKQRLDEVLKQFATEYIEIPFSEILVNINTMEDYRKMIPAK